MMCKTNFQREIARQLQGIELRFDEPMAKHTSFRIGGPAQVMAFPKTEFELKKIINTSKLLDCNIAILGAGTNVLASDDGIDGIVVCLKDGLNGLERVGDTKIRVSAGVTMTRAAVFAANLGLSGLEFAHGIPGTVGGGVYMNAGAYGGQIADVCTAVGVLEETGNIRIFSGGEMSFSYRHSRLEESGGIVLWAEFSLMAAPVQQIKDKMKELMGKRSASQPLDLPSAGSTFKRPVGGYAAALIDEAGLKGFTVGGAAVSTKHAGFVVNLGTATAEDVRSLMEQVSDKVFENSGIKLEPEVRIW